MQTQNKQLNAMTT